MPQPGNTTVIVNPRARGGQLGRRFESLRGVIVKALGPVDFRFTERRGHAAELTQEAVERGVSTLVSFGGDGTHSEVASSIAELGAGDAVGLGILNAGTGGDFRKMLEGSSSLESACRTIAETDPTPVDLARITHLDLDGTESSRHFINITTAGIGGLVDHYVNHAAFRLGGRLDYALATLRAHLHYRPTYLRVIVDGASLGEYELLVACACNGQIAGGGMRFAPSARLADGLLDVVLIEARSLLRLLPLSPRIYSGTHLNAPGVHHTRGRRIEFIPLDEARPAFLDIDGEEAGFGPASIEVIPHAIRVHGPRREVL